MTCKQKNVKTEEDTLMLTSVKSSFFMSILNKKQQIFFSFFFDQSTPLQTVCGRCVWVDGIIISLHLFNYKFKMNHWELKDFPRGPLAKLIDQPL